MDEKRRFYITTCKGVAEAYAERMEGQVKIFCKDQKPEEIQPSLEDLNKITTGL